MEQTDIINPDFLSTLAKASSGMASGNLNIADVRCYWAIHYAATELLSRQKAASLPQPPGEKG